MSSSRLYYFRNFYGGGHHNLQKLVTGIGLKNIYIHSDIVLTKKSGRYKRTTLKTKKYETLINYVVAINI